MSGSHGKNISTVISARYGVCWCVAQACVSERGGAAGLCSPSRCSHPCEGETEMLYLSMGRAVRVRQRVFCVLSVYTHARETTTACLCGVWEGESPGLSVCHSQADLINLFPL